MEDLRKALVGIVGAETREDLMQIKTGLEKLPVPDDERPAMVNAIDLLLEYAD